MLTHKNSHLLWNWKNEDEFVAVNINELINSSHKQVENTTYTLKSWASSQ